MDGNSPIIKEKRLIGIVTIAEKFLIPEEIWKNTNTRVIQPKAMPLGVKERQKRLTKD